MNFEPLYDRIIVRRMDADDVTAGGIFIPATAKEKPEQGEVLHVGIGRIQEDGSIRALLLKPGDKVIFGKYAGTEIKVNNEDVLIMREDEVLGRQIP